MHVAIDVDGTITRAPDLFRELIEALRHNRVTILTGYSYPNPQDADMEGLRKSREAQLREIGFSSFPAIKVCVGTSSAVVAVFKAEFCRDEHVDIFIDDSPDYWAAVRRISPNTIVLGVIK